MPKNLWTDTKLLINKNELSIRVSDIPTDISNKEFLPSGDDLDISNLVVQDNISSIKVLINNLPSDKQYVYIHHNNKVLLAWRGDNLYLNLLKNRNKSIYRKSRNDWIIDGEI